MSADNWAVCPKCAKSEVEEKEALVNQLEETYGKAAQSEYLELFEKSQRPIEFRATLREDYEIGIYDNEFFISYCASCETCNFSHTFKHSERLS